MKQKGCIYVHVSQSLSISLAQILSTYARIALIIQIGVKKYTVTHVDPSVVALTRITNACGPSPQPIA